MPVPTTATSPYRNRLQAASSVYRNRLDFADEFSSTDYIDVIGGEFDYIGNDYDYIGLELKRTDRFSYQNRLNIKSGV